jgi:glyoxylate reductase
VVEADRYVRDGRWRTWEPMTLLGPDVHGSTLGIVGFGRIGQAVARRAAGFGMRVVYHGRTRLAPEAERAAGVEWLTLPELLATADFVSLHVALTPATRHLIDAAALARCGRRRSSSHRPRPGRGHRGAGRCAAPGRDPGGSPDVTDPEPSRGTSARRSWTIASSCRTLGRRRRHRGRMAAMAASNVLAGLRGDRLPHPVNPQAGGSSGLTRRRTPRPPPGR